MLQTHLRALARLLAIALLLPASAGTALANAKIIHVPKVITANGVPHPPANEDEAAGWDASKSRLPRVLRLRRDVTTPAAPWQRTLAPATRIVLVPTYYCCSTVIDPQVPATPDTFYAPVDQVYGGRIYFPIPAWDSANFLPRARWSERRELWSARGTN